MIRKWVYSIAKHKIFVHANTISLYKKYTTIYIYKNVFTLEYSMECITETKLKNNA